MPATLTDNAREVFIKRYVRRSTDGSPAETIDETFKRVAKAVASVEKTDLAVLRLTNEFYHMLSNLDFLPNSPTFTGAGTPLGNLAGCFVLDIEDDMGKSSEGIFSTLRTAALIQQSGGGNGFSFSRLRPRGDVVHSSNGAASGPVSFLRVFDTAFGAIQQGGARRSANMAVMDVSHPDIEEFIHCKSTENDITNFNISVGVSDAFMQAVKADTGWDLTFDGGLYRTVRAKDLFHSIVEQAHHNGEPGVLFLDRANADHPTPHLGRLESSNPCGEQFLLGYENCCLGSINLAQHVTPQGVDWGKLRNTVNMAVRFLDNVIDSNRYVPVVPKLEAAAKRTRRIGLGIMGLADVFYTLRVRYGSNESLILAEKIMEFIHYHAMMSSTELAVTRGPFQAIEKSVFDPQRITWKAPELSKDSHPDIMWEKFYTMLRLHGIRNAAVTTIAPTGTLSTVAGVEGYGCEPAFALSYTRYMVDGDQRKELTYVSPLFEQALLEATEVYEAFDVDDALAEVQRRGSCQRVYGLPAWVKNTFVVAEDITAEQHVRMQASLQKYVSNAISKTCNFPSTATVEDVEQAYLMAWEMGCKGLTVYVSGSREVVVLETQQTRDSKQTTVQIDVDWADGEDTSATSLACPSCSNWLMMVEGCATCSCGYAVCGI